MTLEEQEYLKNKKQITVCVQPNWLPYEGIVNNKFTGISADYLNIISKKINIPLKIITAKTNLKIIEKLKKGACDIKPIATNGTGRLPYKTTDHNIDDYIALVTKTEQPFINDINKHIDKSFVVLESRVRFVKKVKKLYPKITLIKVDTLDNAFKMVLDGKAFGMLGKSKSLLHHINKNFPQKLKVMNEFHKITTGIGVLQGDEILYSIIQKALKSIDEKEKIQIRNNWEITTVELKQDNTFLWYLLGFSFLLLIFYINKSIITRRLKKEVDGKTKELQDEKERFILAIQGSLNGIFDWNIITNEVYYSPRWKSILGYEDNEIPNSFEQWQNRLHPNDVELTTNRVYNYLDGKSEVFDATFRMKHKNGSWVWINARGKASRDENGKALRMVGFHTDVTELVEYRRSLEKLVRERTFELSIQKEEFESIFNYAQDGISIIDLNGNFQNSNQSFLDITGFNKEELLTKNCMELTIDEYKDITQKALEEVISTGKVEQIEKVCRVKNNKLINVTMSMSLLPDKKRILLITHDTTALKLMQEQSRLASLGEMIGNIAHQWRQPLTIITTSISGLRMQSELGEEIREEDIVDYSETIIKQAEYLSNTIDNFRDFVKGDLTYKNISLSQSIEESVKLIDASMSQNFINLVINTKEDIYIFGNSNELVQAFMNILNNSKDILKSNINDEEDRLILISTTKTNEGNIELSIQDSGGGIPQNIIHKVFEPYFTTKHKYMGTGLGLSMAYKIIVERHHGTLTVNNKEFEYSGKKYKGACFTISFPKI